MPYFLASLVAFSLAALVYRAAVESALEESDISPQERGMLATLQDQLGIGAKDAHGIEREARAGAA